MKAVAIAQNPNALLVKGTGRRGRPQASGPDSLQKEVCCVCRRNQRSKGSNSTGARTRVQRRQLEGSYFVSAPGFQQNASLAGDRSALEAGLFRHAKVMVQGRKGGSEVRATVVEPSGEPAPMGQKTQYKDNLIDRIAMNLFRKKMQSVTGAKTKETGYDAFVDVSKALMRGRSAEEQQAAVAKVLRGLMPRHLPYIVRTFFKPNKLALQLNAMFTPPIFSWLVGPAEVIEVEVNGVKQRTGVKIKKCRYLEASGCVGMCVNVCKVPTQDFFTKEFGLPLTMNPNFDDMSCEMVFGQTPPPIEEDKAFKQPCFATLCSMAAEEKPKCPKLLNIVDQ